ncbi:Protein of unknown function [Pyronema omphalodes CBS 100304]|uniref:Uncharacterized protein n=1 Tax=Pyronema omphalodes (strain CBS 100304) TaxID=1076935 RepID=U4LIT4_PYROM|nr:Protein of unknown function [Pyronema omphalodes CBS 100304]
MSRPTSTITIEVSNLAGAIILLARYLASDFFSVPQFRGLDFETDRTIASEYTCILHYSNRYRPNIIR